MFSILPLKFQYTWNQLERSHSESCGIIFIGIGRECMAPGCLIFDIPSVGNVLIEKVPDDSCPNKI